MTNAHDPRTLEERLQWIADWSEPGIDLADAGTAREALDRITAQASEIERIKRERDQAVEALRLYARWGGPRAVTTLASIEGAEHE